MTSPSNDSAISIARTLAGTNPGKQPSRPTSTINDPQRSKSNSPRTPVHISQHHELSVAEQAALDLENSAAVEQAQNEIDIDSGADARSMSSLGSESGYGSDTQGSSSTSLSSSVRDYAFEHGHRYHKFREGTYNFPNEESEQEREDMKHAMMVNLCQKLHFAPLGDNPQHILDMGTGTGIWAIEMGDLYPGANVLGVDLSPIQPEWVPPNVRFMVDDVESPWLRPRNHFDYIHGRHTVMAIRDWPKLMRRVLDHLKPGGWFELQEIHHYPQCHDGSMPPDHPVTQYWAYIIEGLAQLGVNFNATLLLADMMREAGFVNVTTRIFHVPIGVWPRNKVLKMVGLYWRTILIDGLDPIATGPMTRGLKWKKEEVDVWLAHVRKAYMDSWVHAHMPLHVICAQKPEAGVDYSAESYAPEGMADS
ncbi:Methyltransferase LAE1 [Hyphodiscus hymeniophilus]|uniref:Methyltransferase LAE1 n=1 Tax=Hyphodiscus hymeniophilus TaxID=353542 RepID=A0A9P7AYM1_9HELO|nr:Methyltransferase LAE1 [Hyphodiscus hymeniophilus]